MGALARFGVAGLIQMISQHAFPFSTLVINFSGSLAIGFLFEWIKGHALQPTVTLFVGVGFLGAFTTFSTFSFETVALAKRGEVQLASLNAVSSVLLCLGGVVLGEWLGRACRV